MENNYIKKVFGNSAWMILSKIINILVGFAVSVLITRYLGPEQKGEMANAQALASFWSFLASFGLLDILISRFASDRENSGKIAATGMAIMLCGGIVAFSLGIISSLALGVSRNVFIYVIVSGIVYLFQCLSVYEYWFYSNLESKRYAIYQSVIHIIFLIVRSFGVWYELDVLYFVLMTSIETIVTYFSLLPCYRKNRTKFKGPFRFDIKISKNMLKLALPMLVMGFASTIYMKVDQIMVGKMLTSFDLGVYSVAVTLSEYWYFIPAAIYSSFLPVITQCFEEGNAAFENRLQQFADIMTFISYFIAAGVMVFGHLAITMLYGYEFEKSAYILMIYIWSGVFTCLSYSGQAYYVIHKDTKTIMMINISGAVINFLLNIILIRLLGSAGAAVATLVEYMIVAFGQMLILRKKYSGLYKIQLKSFFPFVRVMKYARVFLGR